MTTFVHRGLVPLIWASDNPAHLCKLSSVPLSSRNCTESTPYFQHQALACCSVTLTAALTGTMPSTTLSANSIEFSATESLHTACHSLLGIFSSVSIRT